MNNIICWEILIQKFSLNIQGNATKKKEKSVVLIINGKIGCVLHEIHRQIFHSTLPQQENFSYAKMIKIVRNKQNVTL